jgi:hypothetical protein
MLTQMLLVAIGLGLLIVFDVLALRYGADSRRSEPGRRDWW